MSTHKINKLQKKLCIYSTSTFNPPAAGLTEPISFSLIGKYDIVYQQNQNEFLCMQYIKIFVFISSRGVLTKIFEPSWQTLIEAVVYVIPYRRCFRIGILTAPAGANWPHLL